MHTYPRYGNLPVIYSHLRPTWFRKETKEVEEKIVKLARRGRMPSEIGVIFRDEHGVFRKKTITDKILRILKATGLRPEMAEVYFLSKKAVNMRTHLL